VPKVCYVERNFSAGSREIIDHANDIIDEYSQQGFDLTLRQLYYQFVSRDLIANKQTEYKRLGSIINDARLAGEVDWEAIVDRTRELEKDPDWESPADIIGACSRQFRFDKWADQEHRVEVWIEKDALTGVIEGVCSKLQVPYFSCRGYTSQSEMWVAGQRLIDHATDGQTPVVLHLGDHDPSGIDMSRDITGRLEMFLEHEGWGGLLKLKRIALNMSQVQKYKPPPNPTKFTDSRATGYAEKYGMSSWELDALEPQVMTKLIRREVLYYRDQTKWIKQEEREKKAKEALRFAADCWDRIQFISEDGDWSDDAFEDFEVARDEEEHDDGED
jgi:hypothetical protein